MATKTLSWPVAVDLVCDQLVEFAAHRDADRTPAEAAAAMGITPRTAKQYERAITLLLAALKTTATPDRAGSGVAGNPAPTQ